MTVDVAAVLLLMLRVAQVKLAAVLLRVDHVGGFGAARVCVRCLRCSSRSRVLDVTEPRFTSTTFLTRAANDK